jgi:cytochrome P450
MFPITLPNGTATDKIVLTKGTTISIQTEVMNRSQALWGEDAAEFHPGRWLEPLPGGAQAIVGYHHLMTFLDGPKACV